MSMRYVFAPCLLLAAAAFIASPAAGQDKKGAKKGANAGVIEVAEGKDKKFRFTVRDADGKFLLNSGANNFASAKDAQQGAEDFKKVVASAKIGAAGKGKSDKGGVIEVAEGKDKKFRFTVRNADGKFLGNSGANNFATAKDAQQGAEDFKKVVASAKIGAAGPKKK